MVARQVQITCRAFFLLGVYKLSLFSDAMVDAVSGLEDNAGEPIVYIANSVSHVIDFAIPGQEEAPEGSSGGMTTISSRTLDWMIEKSRFPTSEPMRGNIIVRESGKRYQVAAPNGGACWRWSGPSEAYYRIQTVEVK